MKLPLPDLITLFSWAFAICLQIIFMVVAALIYQKNKEKVFGWYAIYCFLMFLYCGTKIPDFLFSMTQVRTWKSNPVYQSFYWYLQILYHLSYLSFGILFVQLQLYRPVWFYVAKRYIGVIAAAGTAFFIAGAFNLFYPAITSRFFFFVFMPLHIGLSLALLVVITKLPKKSYVYITAAALYMLLILVSFALSYSGTGFGPVRAPAVFYIGISIESCIFSLGLSLKVRNIYRERLSIQFRLNEVHTQLEKELKAQLETQQRERKLLEQLKEKQELDIEVEKLYNQVLRSQLNSHFVFNVLNSIKLFILEKNTHEASRYLSKFARFIRLVLDSSMHEYHTLKEELNMLELYVSIERIRLGKQFDFSIDTDPVTDTSHIRIPALLLQPFVENALWHGIMKVEAPQKLSINIFTGTTGTGIRIDDNGPGIDSREIRSANKTRSYGLQITEARIKHHNHTQVTKISRTITDKKRIGLQGTRVEIWISHT